MKISSERLIKKYRIDKFGDVWTEPDINWWLEQANKYEQKKSNEKFVAILTKKGYPSRFIKAKFDDFGNAEFITPKMKPFPKIKDLFQEE